ncbi:MAG TPA: asparagine synthase (glutamine-hydrolyzing) [Blastocatellia bacterium]|nr:asparagine synthase (glutamine-hydrolyzing) [Blastocatellia bacterium]
MCGISGAFQIKPEVMDWPGVLSQMSSSLTHRGPDDGGLWFDAEVGIGLSQRRLSVVDLSPEGHQPMISADGRYVVVFNGEIYNFGALRHELEPQGHRFRGHSDTEVMLAAICEWGLEAAVKRFVGMFAFALWDQQERALHLVRDRIGEKPLYYGWAGSAFLFGSELKALRAHPAWRGEIDRGALALFVRHSYVPTPYSIYEGISKLIPGTIFSLTPSHPTGKLTTYWSARQAAEAGIQNPLLGSETDVLAQLEDLLLATIAGQMIADVPLGAFLSGGIDSSLVVALMQAQSTSPVKTFTIGFHEADFNEAEFAKAVAQHLGTSHTELYVTPTDALNVIPRLPTLYDEPFADASQVPTFLVSELTRRSVTVSLSGDGGDELFGGYNRYFWGQNIWNKVGWMPRELRKIAAAGITTIAPASWDAAFQGLDPVLPSKLKQRTPGDKMHKLAEVLAVDHPEVMYRRLVSSWKVPTDIVLHSQEPETILTDKNQWANLPNFMQRMMYLDLMTYLPDDILVKVDRAAMGVSLETRVPYLDHRVVEFAWRIPLALKIREGKGKWLLRQLLYKYVPPSLIERPKTGFGIPIVDWLRGPLREWAEALVHEARLQQEGFFEPTEIRTKWKEHLTGQRNWQYYLWPILMFQAWLSENKPAH